MQNISFPTSGISRSCLSQFNSLMVNSLMVNSLMVNSLMVNSLMAVTKVPSSILVLISAACLICSCSLLNGNFRNPDVSIVNLEFTNATLFETSALFEVRIDNENAQDYNFSGAVHRLYINGVQFGKGFDKEFSLPALSSTTRKINVTISHLSLLTKMNKLVNSDEVNYRLETTLHPKGLSLSSIDIEHSGKMELSPSQPEFGNIRRFRPSTDFEPEYQKADDHGGFFID